jgi:predicted nucleotidyltransferase
VADPAPGLPSVEFMVLSESHRQHWLQLCAAETDALERRRALLRQAARAVAADLRQRWPGLALWLFGSVLGPGLHGDSDLDLAVAGLPPAELLEALSQAEACAAAALERLGAAPVVLDLVRLEALPPHWQARIRAEGEALS